MKLKKKIGIRLEKERQISPIELVQNDTGIQLEFEVLDFDIPTGTSATLYVRKKSGKFVYQENNISVDGNIITVDLENQAITEYGEAFYQLELLNGSDTVSTFASKMWIKKSYKNSDAVESKTVIAAFDTKTAEEIAKIQEAAEKIAEQVIASIPEDYTTMEAKTNEFANAIKRNRYGAIVTTDDVSPVEHNLKLKANGKNLFDCKKIEVVDTYQKFFVPVEVGKVYTVSSNIPQSAAAEIYFNGDFTEANGVWNGHSRTFVAETDELCISFQNRGNLQNVLNGTYYVQFEKGETATTYEPYIDPTTVNVRRCGKNLIPFNDSLETTTVKGITFTVNKDKSITCNGTATANATFNLTENFRLPVGRYMLRGCPKNGSDAVRLQTNKIIGGTASTGAIDIGTGCVLPVTEECKLYTYIVVLSGQTVSNFTFKPYIFMESDEDTGYETPINETYTPDPDGTVSGVTSLSPNMTILTDTEGVNIECEYNVDTQKYINRMFRGSARVGEVTLTASGWIGDASPYSQVVSLANVTENSQVDLTPSVEQLTIFYNKDLAFVTENEDGVVTVYAIGQKPTNDYTMQVTITEVFYE